MKENTRKIKFMASSSLYKVEPHESNSMTNIHSEGEKIDNQQNEEDNIYAGDKLKSIYGGWSGKHYLQTDTLPTDQWPKSIQKIINAGGFSNTKEGSLRAKIVPLIIYFVYYPLAAYVVYEFLFVSGCHPVISFLYAFGCSQSGYTVGFIRNRDSARERYRREVVYCLGQGQQNQNTKFVETLFLSKSKGAKFFWLLFFTAQVMVSWPFILRYFVENHIISLIIAVAYLAACVSSFHISVCVFNYATFNLAITPIVVHNYTYAYVKAMKEAVLSTNIGSEESLKQLKRLRKDWEWHLKINKQRDDNKVMRACYFALVISFALGTAIIAFGGGRGTLNSFGGTISKSAITGMLWAYLIFQSLLAINFVVNIFKYSASFSVEYKKATKEILFEDPIVVNGCRKCFASYLDFKEYVVDHDPYVEIFGVKITPTITAQVSASSFSLLIIAISRGVL